MKTQTKISASIILTALISGGSFAAVSYVEARKVVNETAFADLEALRNAKSADIREFFENKTRAAEEMSRDVLVATALTDLQSAYRNINQGGETVLADVSSNVRDYYERQALPPIAKSLGMPNAPYDTYGPKTRAARHLQNIFNVQPKSSRAPRQKTYKAMHGLYDNKLKSMSAFHGFADILLIDWAEGDVIYSAEKGIDFGTNVYSGAFSNTLLGRISDDVRNATTLHISDIELYAPARNAASVFISAPVYDEGVPIGILALRMNAEQISALSAFGLTERRDRDVYLAGGDYLMRSNAPYAQNNLHAYIRLFKEAGGSDEVAQKIKLGRSTILAQKVETEAVTAALGGEIGALTTQNYLGTSVMSAYAPLTIGENDWVILAERNTETIQTPFAGLVSRLAVAAAIFVPFLLLLALWLAARLMRPVRVMVQTARAISSGENLIFSEDKSEWGRLGAELNKAADNGIWQAPSAAQKLEPRKPIKLISIEVPKKSTPSEQDKAEVARERDEPQIDHIQTLSRAIEDTEVLSVQAMEQDVENIVPVVEKPSVAVWGLKAAVTSSEGKSPVHIEYPESALKRESHNTPNEAEADSSIIANLQLRVKAKPKERRFKHAARSDAAIRDGKASTRIIAPRAKRKPMLSTRLVVSAPSKQDGHKAVKKLDVEEPLELTQIIVETRPESEIAAKPAPVYKKKSLDSKESSVPLNSDDTEIVLEVSKPKLSRRRRRRR